MINRIEFNGTRDELRQFARHLGYKKPGLFKSYRALGGFALKVTTIVVILGVAISCIASSCSLHRPWNELAKQQPGIIMSFTPVYVEPMPNVVPAIDLDANQELSI